MDSKKAKKYIRMHKSSLVYAENSMDSSEFILSEDDAIEAINIAELDMKVRAIEGFRQFVVDYCIQSGRAEISESAEHYIEVFIKLLEGEKIC